MAWAVACAVAALGCTASDAVPAVVLDTIQDVATPDAGLDVPVADADTTADVGGEAWRCKRHDPERLPFFGDLHVHTALSLDANLQGTRLRPADAYRFARGEAVGISPHDAEGKPLRTAQLDRPLDFVALTDHAEFLGLVTTCLTPGLAGYDSPECDDYRAQPDVAFFVLNSQLSLDQDSAAYPSPCAEGDHCGSAALSAWTEVVTSANAANDTTPECSLAAFVAYEWSASPGTRNLHRNVIFRGDTVPALPFSYFDGSQEEALWDALDKDCLKRADGDCDVLTIPHNSNLSAGLMFEPVDGDGDAIDADYASRRARMEPLVEIFQHKGSSECLPEMGKDELCDFERIPWNTLASAALSGKPDTMIPRDFVRHALGEGLQLAVSLGVDPFQFGFVGSTDTHLATPGAVAEQGYPGHGGAGAAVGAEVPPGLSDTVWMNPGGLAVLWAEENTRDALFDAMRRREAYATSGPRIVLRFFGGADLPADLCEREDFVKEGYGSGVPMGGVLSQGTSGGVRFAIRAAMDPGTEAHPGAPLAAIQIVKGWLQDGEVRYAILNVAGDPTPSPALDLDSCTPPEAGAPELCTVWADPDFDAAVPAFYYARVLEVPTCRWQTTICREAKVDCTAGAVAVKNGFEGCCEGAPEAHQERAWSSPIFVGIGALPE